MTRAKAFVCLAVIALAGYACSDRPQPQITEVELPAVSADMGTMDGVFDLQDGNHGGNANFLWLPPVVTGDVNPPGPLASGLAPKVEICDKDGVCSTHPASENGSHYHFDLKSGIEGKPLAGSPYRIRVYLFEDYLLGSFSVALNSNGNIPLRFWIGESFPVAEVEACIEEDRCDLGTVVSGEGGTVEVTTPFNGGSEIIAAAVFPPNWSPGGVDRTVIIDCRNDLPSEFADDGSGPLNTGLTQLPWYCDFSVDPPLDPGEQFNEDVTVEVCETVDMDHATVVLGKSSGPGLFELLPFVFPTQLDACFADYQSPEIGDASGFWNGLSRRLGAVLQVIGPEPLRARMLRDGGAGGTTRVFSAINPVIPAGIEGLVLDGDGDGIFGADVTLTQGSTEIESTDTGEGGFFSFVTPLAGGAYTVTVSGVEATFQGGNAQDVTITESDHYEVRFLPVGFFYYEETGNYYSSDAVGRTWNDARDDAAEQSFAGCYGQLATIRSQGENDFISTNMPQATTGGYWLGGFDASGEGAVAAEWAWDSGEPFDYANWHAGEPNGFPEEGWIHFFGRFGVPADEWNDTLLNGIGAGWGSTLEFVCGEEEGPF